MLIKDTIPIVYNTTAHPQSTDPNLEQKGISIAMPNHQQLHIHIIYIRPRSSCSADHNASIAHLLRNSEMSLIVGEINAHLSRLDTNTNIDEKGEQLSDEIDTADNTMLDENEATRLPTNSRSTSPDIIWPPLTSHYYFLVILHLTGQRSSAHRHQHQHRTVHD